MLNSVLNLIDSIQAKNENNQDLKMLLTTNSKLKKENIYNFNLPAGKTCLFAGECRKFCYAMKGNFRFKNVIASHEYNLKIAKSDNFVNHINDNILNLPGLKFLRIHASGDFFNESYIQKWVKIARNNPNIIFYAYTKAMILFKGIKLPENFLLIQSTDTINDLMYVDKSKPYAKVIDKKDLDKYLKKGFINSTNSDLNTIKAILLNKNVVLAKH